MHKIAIGFIIGALMVIGWQGLAYHETQEEIQAASFRACNFWSYDFDASGYVCRSLGGYVDAAESSDIAALDATITHLHARIDVLEERIADLEP